MMNQPLDPLRYQVILQNASLDTLHMSDMLVFGVDMNTASNKLKLTLKPDSEGRYSEALSFLKSSCEYQIAIQILDTNGEVVLTNRFQINDVDVNIALNVDPDTCFPTLKMDILFEVRHLGSCHRGHGVLLTSIGEKEKTASVPMLEDDIDIDALMAEVDDNDIEKFVDALPDHLVERLDDALESRFQAIQNIIEDMSTPKISSLTVTNGGTAYNTSNGLFINPSSQLSYTTVGEIAKTVTEAITPSPTPKTATTIMNDLTGSGSISVRPEGTTITVPPGFTIQGGEVYIPSGVYPAPLEFKETTVVAPDFKYTIKGNTFGEKSRATGLSGLSKSIREDSTS